MKSSSLIHSRILLCGMSILIGATSVAAEHHFTLDNPLRVDGVTVKDSSSPGFVTEVAKFLDPEALAAAAPFLPFSLIIVNDTGRYVWGFTVVYTYPDWIAPSGNAWRYQFSHSAGVFDYRRMLQPGSEFLITPVSDFTALRNGAGKVLRKPYLDEGSNRMITAFAANFGKNERMEASIDSVIFEDGTLIGPDTSGSMDRINSRIRAHRDLADSLSNLAGEDLRKQLLFYKQLKPRDEYSDHKATLVEVLLNAYDTQGESRAKAVLEGLQAHKWFSNSQLDLERIRRKP